MLVVLCAQVMNYNLDVVNHAEQFSNSLCCLSVYRNDVRVKEFTFYYYYYYLYLLFFSLSLRLKLLFTQI